MGALSPSWKTTVGGLISAVGGVLMQVEEPKWMKSLGTVLLAAGPAVVGCCARDDGNTSEKVGAHKPSGGTQP